MFFFVRIFFICPHPHKPDCYTPDNSCPKKYFCEEIQLYFEISLLSFIYKIFEAYFYQKSNSLLSADIWTHENVDEKTHTFS